MTEQPPTPIRMPKQEQQPTPMRIISLEETVSGAVQEYRIDRVAVQVVVAILDAAGQKVGERPCQPTILFEPLEATLPAHLTEALRAVRDAVRSEEG